MWIGNVFVNYFLIYGLILHLHMTVSICVCIEMYLWEESHLYMNHKIQVWILLCAFINIDTKITPYKSVPGAGTFVYSTRPVLGSFVWTSLVMSRCRLSSQSSAAGEGGSHHRRGPGLSTATAHQEHAALRFQGVWVGGWNVSWRYPVTKNCQ